MNSEEAVKETEPPKILDGADAATISSGNHDTDERGGGDCQASCNNENAMKTSQGVILDSASDLTCTKSTIQKTDAIEVTDHPTVASDTTGGSGGSVMTVESKQDDFVIFHCVSYLGASSIKVSSSYPIFIFLFVVFCKNHHLL